VASPIKSLRRLRGLTRNRAEVARLPRMDSPYFGAAQPEELRVHCRLARTFLAVRSWLAQVWQETGSALRIALVTLPAAGVMLFILSVWGDKAGFWQDKPFLTNMASAVIGALFAVPFAVVILQRLSIDQASRIEKVTVRRLAGRAGAELAASAAATVGCNYLIGESPRYGPSYQLVLAVDQAVDAATQLVSFFDEPEDLTGVTRVSSGYTITGEQADHLLSVIESTLSDWLVVLGDEREFRRRIANVKSRLEFLTGPVQTRILESSLPWVDVSAVEDCGGTLIEVDRIYARAWYPDLAKRIKDEFSASYISRSDIFASRREKEREFHLSYNFCLEISECLRDCSVLVGLLITFAELAESVGKALTAMAE
jgi:hypothetical protein